MSSVCPGRGAIGGGDRLERVEMEAKRQHAKRRRPADAVTMEQVVAHAAGHAEEAIRAARQHALEADEQPGRQAGKVALQHMAMVGVDDADAPAWMDCVVDQRANAAEQPGLRHVSMQDVRPKRAHHSVQRDRRTQVRPRRDGPLQDVEVLHGPRVLL